MNIDGFKAWAIPFVPFAVIAMLFALAYAATMVQVGVSETTNRRLLDDMLVSIDLVQRMGRDVDRMRALVEEHLRSRDPAEMASFEAEIAALEDDGAAAASDYAPRATLPGEAAKWAQLQQRIADFEAAIAAFDVQLRKTLALSRVNRDVAARASMLELDEHFSGIESSIAELVTMNRSQSVRILEQVERLHRTAVRRVRNLALLGIAVSLAVGVLTARVLRRGHERLRRYSTALEEKNRELDAFAGRVAHDLRGPLSTVGLATSRLERRWPETRETTAAMHRAVKRISLLIDDLLALSRMTTAEASAVGDPATAAAQVREDLVPGLQDTDVAVSLDVQPANVQCGESLLRQVLWNLVDNSVKYRRRDVHTEVEIRGRPMDGTYELSVRDNGSGMSPDEASHAFDPLFRGEGARQQPGSGLGLSIVKRVIDVNGGTITIDSRPGEGTTFCTLLPLVKGAPDRRRGIKTTPSNPS